ncbi:PRTRC system protein B [Bacteroides sp. AF34-31BH]|uniref:prokaryotic E2 ligase family D protein n=1 Tax=Bacteroides sp. AF34-31BH TaxID=2292931 RepID=UPI000E743B9A|nr:prokaryotic E2 ligase family D protein [Bacteroides sp. AF34-31BH]RJV08725.1 PRTRC system protein B [Bacteroides sp. AF34-31BH]
MLETNELTRKLRTLLHPQAALIVYAEEKDNHNTYSNNYFVEVRDIEESGRMGEGRPVTVEFMNELVRGYSESHSTTPYGRIPSNLLWCEPSKGSEKYIWYNPPQKRMMFFRDVLKIESAEYNLPGVIYEAGESWLNVYAYKDKILTDKTDLFAAPFFNVTGASVCLGSAKIEKPKDLTYANLLEYWEKKFWLTEFSHLGGGGNPTKSNLVLVTKAAKDKPFNLEELKPLNKLKLKDILR